MSAQPIFPNYIQMREKSRLPIRAWHVLRMMSVLTALALVVILVTRPQTGLLIMWGLAVPVLPLLWFVVPGIWRNICPWQQQIRHRACLILRGA